MNEHRVVVCAITGASGRMGRHVIEAVDASGDMQIGAAWVSPASSSLGRVAHANLPDLKFSRLGECAMPPDVVIDFALPEGFDATLRWCVDHRVALVSGTTGLSSGQHKRLATASADIPVLWAANFSLGIAVLEKLVALSASHLPGWDIEILEAHHAGKRDAPSGTAIALGRRAAQARGQLFDAVAVRSRDGGNLQRRSGDIGFASIRASDIVGEHTVLLAGAAERIELSHRAVDRAVFAQGAVHAAHWLAGRAPGLYPLSATLPEAS